MERCCEACDRSREARLAARREREAEEEAGYSGQREYERDVRYFFGEGF